MSVSATTSERTAETASKPFSAALIGDFLQLVDMALFILLGLTIYFLYVYPEEPHTLGQYLVTVLVAAIMSYTIFHWLGVYWRGFIFTKGLRVNRMLAALGIVFAVILGIAFTIKISDHF